MGWNSFWERFDRTLNKTLGNTERVLHKLETADGIIRVHYENGHLSVKVEGVIKSIRINDQRIEVRAK